MTQEYPDDARFQLGVISGKIDLVLVQLASDRAQNETRFSKIEETQEAHGEAIASLKQSRSWLMGGAAAIATAVSAVAGLLQLK